MVANAADIDPAQPQRLRRQQGVLRHQSAVDGSDQQLLRIAGLGLGHDLGVAVVIGAEHQKLGRLHHIGLIARQHGQLLTRLGLADSHNTGHLQKARG